MPLIDECAGSATKHRNQGDPLILFIGEAVTAAHVLRSLVLSREMVRRGWQVCLATDNRYQSLIRKSRLRFFPLASISPHVFLHRLRRGAVAYTFSELCRYVEDETELLREIRPDLVISDFRITLPVSCTRANIPLISLANAQWCPFLSLPVPLPALPVNRLVGVPLMESLKWVIAPILFGLHLHNYNKFRRYYHLSPFANLREVYTAGDQTMYMDCAELFGAKELPDNHRFIGPVHGLADVSLPKWWKELPEDRPLIFFAPGSSGSGRVMKKVLDAVGKTKVTLMVATAGKSLGNISGTTRFVADYLPGKQAVQRADLVICNGGSGMVYLALDAGTPVLSIPELMDQFYVAQALVRAGAGLMVRPERISTRTISSSVERLLKERSFSRRAGELGRLARTYNPVGELERSARDLIGATFRLNP